MTDQHLHRLPEGLGPKLDLKIPPSNPWCARNYAELVALLEEIGQRLDGGDPSLAWLRNWEERVMYLLRGGERDQFMAPPEENEFDVEFLPEQRYRSLRGILMDRKGLRQN